MEGSGLETHVVLAVTGSDVIIVRPTIQRHMTGCCDLGTLAVVGDLVGAEDVVAKIDLSIATQIKNVTFFLLLFGLQGDGFAIAGNDSGVGGIRSDRRLTGNG